MDIPLYPGQHEFGSVILEERSGFQGALKIISNSNHAQIKIAYSQSCDKLLVGSITDLSGGDIGKGIVYPFLFNVNGKYLMVQFMELLGHMAAKTPQPDQQN